MTISTPDIVTILRQRIDQCRCLGAVPATRCCGGCEHDGRCLTEIVEVRRERDEARREVCELQAHEANRLSSAVRLKGWICFEEKTEVGA
jgi:hypothetical protein